MEYKTKFIFFYLSLSLLTSCGGTHNNTNRTGTSFQPTFSSIRDQILIPACVKCHRNFEEYNEVYRRLTLPGQSYDDDNILEQIQEGSMPPGVKLTATETNIIRQWINRGAPND